MEVEVEVEVGKNRVRCGEWRSRKGGRRWSRREISNDDDGDDDGNDGSRNGPRNGPRYSEGDGKGGEGGEGEVGGYSLTASRTCSIICCRPAGVWGVIRYVERRDRIHFGVSSGE